MKIIIALCALLAGLKVEAQLTNLGNITISTHLIWDKNLEPDLFGYYIYARPISNAVIYRVATKTNGIPARQLIGTNGNGEYVIYATAVNTAGMESEPSASYRIGYALTNIVAPSNFQFLMITVATNLIPLQQLN